MIFFKVQLRLIYGERRLWIPVRASFVADALGIAISRCHLSEFEVIDDSITVIGEKEYLGMLHHFGL
jgi:hypothetical protein